MFMFVIVLQCPLKVHRFKNFSKVLSFLRIVLLTARHRSEKKNNITDKKLYTIFFLYLQRDLYNQ